MLRSEDERHVPTVGIDRARRPKQRPRRPEHLPHRYQQQHLRMRTLIRRMPSAGFFVTDLTNYDGIYAFFGCR